MDTPGSIGARNLFSLDLKMAIGEALQGFMRVRWMAFVIIGCAPASSFSSWQTIPSELAPMEDRNRIRTSITGPEGSDFDLTDRINYEIAQMLLDSIPEKGVVLAFAPGFGGGGSNASFISMGLIDASESEKDARSRSHNK